MEITIVSGTYNRLEHLKRMVLSVRKSVGNIPYDIILVDGGSTDGTIKWCHSQPDIKVIEQGELLGGVVAFNAGCRAARGKYVAILNDDIEVVGSTLKMAYNYLEDNHNTAQVAFKNKPTSKAAEPRSAYSHSYGFLYGQCCLTRRWVGDHVGWWGGPSLHTYGGDSRLGLRIWEIGYKVVKIDGCKIIDHVVEDKMRQERRNLLRPKGPGTPHKDTMAFRRIWNGRLPRGTDWIEAPQYRLLFKAAQGQLRTLRFRHLRAGVMRGTQLRIFKEFGPSEHVNQTKIVSDHGIKKFQNIVKGIIKKFKPDLVMFQAHGAGNIMPETVLELRETYPWMYFTNFDGDMHNPLRKFHFEIAKACHLQLLISSDLFPAYINNGAYNVAWWSTATEDVFVKAGNSRPVPTKLDGPDVVCLMNRTPPEVFPNAQTRIDAVIKLANNNNGVKFQVWGVGWDRHNVRSSGVTYNDDNASAELYRTAKMALCISQSRDLYGYTSNRVFFAGGAGCPILVERFNGMERLGFIDGETVIGFSGMDEMESQIDRYLKQPTKREQIGRNGRELVLARHTYKPRIKALLAYLDGLGVP